MTNVNNAPSEGIAKPANSSELLTIQQASEICGITVNSLRQYKQLLKVGIERGPKITLAGINIRYKRADVEDFTAKKAGL